MYLKILLIFLLTNFTLDSSASPEIEKPKVNEREVSILYYQGAYVPSKVTVFEGEDLVLHFGNFSGTPQCLWSKSLDFFTSTYQGRVSSSHLTNLRPGTYKMSCPTESGTSQLELVVLSKKSDIKRLLSSIF